MTPEPYEHLSPRTRDEELFRDALHRTADPLSLQPDLVPDAVREGHRRRARTRAFTIAGAFVAVTAATLGLAVLGPWLLTGPEAEPAAPAGPSHSSSSPVPSPQRTEPLPEMPSPTSTPESKGPEAGPTTPPASIPPRSLPSGPEEVTRLEEFRQWAAGALDALLPASIGTVLPVGDDAQSYRGRRGSIVHSVRLSVHPDPGSAAPACRDIPEKGPACQDLTLDDGTPAHVLWKPAPGRTGTEVSLRYRSGRSTVALSVSPPPSGTGGAPVTAGDLVRVVQSPRFRELIAYADEHPVERSGAAS
jgi:hypothetical protein